MSITQKDIAEDKEATRLRRLKNQSRKPKFFLSKEEVAALRERPKPDLQSARYSMAGERQRLAPGLY